MQGPLLVQIIADRIFNIVPVKMFTLYVCFWMQPCHTTRDGPLLVVASGRDTIPVAAAVKKLAPEATFVVQV